MPVNMEPHASEEPTVQVKKESNNNEDNINEKQTVYDVLGGDDQELARRQYLDDEADEFDSDERQDDLSRRKRLATGSTAVKRDETMTDETSTNNGGSDVDSNNKIRTHDENCMRNDSANGHSGEDYDYPSNGNSRYEAGNESRGPRREHQFDEPEQMRKLFIGGLDYKTSEATLKQHFEKFGDVIDCVVMREPQSKRSRGFGFVIYASSLMVDNAQEARPHEVDGREVQSKRAISREDSGKPEAQATVKKVYLGGLSDDIEESELREYFKEFGNIVNVNIVAHKDTGKRRGFAFVEYDDYDPVDKIVLRKFHTIKDKRIEAKKAIPKVEMDARKRGDPRSAMAGAMIAMSGPPLDVPSGRSRAGRNGASAACLWEGGPYGSGGYSTGYAGQAGGLDSYPPHYHSPSAHYGASAWMMHGGAGVGGQSGGGPYGFRGAHTSSLYGRNSYVSQAGNWTTTADYGAFPAAQSGGGSGGPMRLSYQHRGWGPYGSGYGAHRGRGYNP